MDELEDEVFEEAVLSECITKDAACKIVSECNCITKMTLACHDELIDRIFDAQPADVVEVVRCKDCKYYSFNGYRNTGTCTDYELDINYYGEFAVLNPKPDFFCAYGERKMNDV